MISVRSSSVLGLLALLLLSLGACRSGPTEDDQLPAEFAVRSDTPYITGSIIERTERTGDLRIRVRSGDSAARVPEAIVTVLPGAVMRWTNGSRASSADLQPGRSVMVWVTGAELRSLPPQVSGNGFVLRRW